MPNLNPYPLSVYQELEPLCEKGHVVLVQNTQDGQLYVKKQIFTYEPSIYWQLREKPVKNTPVIYGIYENPEKVPEAPGASSLILIEEYLPGHTLAEYIQNQRIFSEEMCIDISMQLCRILMKLHERKPAIIHRDIKPSNVMLLPDGTVKLIDFNAAKTASGNEKRDTVLIGTAGFAAPEQYGFSASTPQTDLYAMGVLMNIMLIRALPWEKKAVGKLYGIISRCLKMEPKSRYAGAWDLYAALKRVKKQRVPWLLPGFRTLCWYKMIPAFLWYVFVFIFAVRADVAGIAKGDQVVTQLTLWMLGMFPALFYGNYMDVQRFYPFMRSPKRVIRILGLVVAPLFLLFCMVVILAIVSLLMLLLEI